MPDEHGAVEAHRLDYGDNVSGEPLIVATYAPSGSWPFQWPLDPYVAV